MVCCTGRVEQSPVFKHICRVNPTRFVERNGPDICVCRFNRHFGRLLSGQACRVTRRAHRLRLLTYSPEALAVAVRFRRRLIQFPWSRSRRKADSRHVGFGWLADIAAVAARQLPCAKNGHWCPTRNRAFLAAAPVRLSPQLVQCRGPYRPIRRTKGGPAPEGKRRRRPRWLRDRQAAPSKSDRERRA